jgi:hypothetical protein
LLRRGVGPDEAVSIIIEPVEGLALARRKSRVCVVATGLTGADIDRLIKHRDQIDAGSFRGIPSMAVYLGDDGQQRRPTPENKGDTTRLPEQTAGGNHPLGQNKQG